MSLSLNKPKALILLAQSISLSIVVLTMQACDDPEPPDVQAPSVYITGVKNMQEVWNMTEIKAEATDDRVISKVELSVDDSLVSTLQEAPFTFNWDSNTVPDGGHTLKVVAYDAGGNTAEDAVPVIVKNILVRIPVYVPVLANEGGYREKGYVFLSDKNGKLITVQQFHNDSSIELKSSTFNDDDTFYLTECIARDNIENADDHTIRLWTYTGRTRGSYWSPQRRSDEKPLVSVGEAILNCTGGRENFRYEITTFGGSASLEGASGTVSLNLARKNAFVFVSGYNLTDEEETPRYYGYDGITPGENSIDLSLVNNSLNNTLPPTFFFLPGNFTTASVKVDGFAYSEPIHYDFPHPIGTFFPSPDVINAYVPRGFFAAYLFHVGVTGPKYHHQSGIRGNLNYYYVDLPYKNLTFNFSPEQFTYSADGYFDFFELLFQSGSPENAWKLILPKANSQSVPILELPAELSHYNVPALQDPVSYRVIGLGNVEDYDDIIDQAQYSSYDLTFFKVGQSYFDTEFEF